MGAPTETMGADEVEAEAVGNPWEDEEIKKQCFDIYRKEWEDRKPDYEEMIEDLQDKKDTAHERSHDEEDKVTDEKLKKIEGLYRQRVAATKNVMNKCNGESNTALATWYQEDRASFAKADKDGSGYLEEDEFCERMKTFLKMDEEESKIVLAKWDIDEDKNIGPVEYCTLMAYFRAEVDLQEQKRIGHIQQDFLDTIYPGGLKCAAFMMNKMCGLIPIYGFLCSLPTVCGSWCCYVGYNATVAGNLTNMVKNKTMHTEMKTTRPKALKDAQQKCKKKFLENNKAKTLEEEVVEEEATAGEGGQFVQGEKPPGVAGESQH